MALGHKDEEQYGDTFSGHHDLDQRKDFVMTVLVALLAVSVSAAYYYGFSNNQPLSSGRTIEPDPEDVPDRQQFNVDFDGGPDPVPFVMLTNPDWKSLHKSLEAYRSETEQILQKLSMALDVTLQSEEFIRTRKKYSDHLRDKISRLAEIYESDQETLKRILVPFPAKLMLPSSSATVNGTHKTGTDPPTHHQSNSSTNNKNNTQQTGFTRSTMDNSRFRTLMADQQPYDALGQVAAHMVRDWSVEGALIRDSLYSWCLEQFREHSFRREEPILVPGAGLGRLAWELATKLECSVEAIESSLCMAAAAHSILDGRGRFSLHPYAADLFTNEVDAAARYSVVSIPDVDTKLVTGKGRVSFTVGAFQYEYMQNSRNHYSAVVTCFFIDTATTVYDYLTTIETILVGDGLWINVGPLQWHRNNQVPVAVDELRMIVENYCNERSGKPVFEVLHWQVDSQPVNYRDDGRLRSTHFDAYCPLRFVLRKVKG